MNAVLVDDEIDNISILKWELGRLKTSINIVQSFTSSVDAYEYLKEEKVDVVFLDIDMPDMTGFELLAALDDFQFQVIFVTAYNEYAIEAFKHNTVDYLLKPILSEDLKRAIDKLEKTAVVSEGKTNSLNALLEEQNIVHKLPIVSKSSIVLLEPRNIVYLESDDNYTKLFTIKDGELKRHMASKTLKTFEERLDQILFIKTHRSYLVNRNFVTELGYEDGNAFLMLQDKIKLPISRSNKERIFELFS